MEKKSEDLLESFGQKLSGRALVKKISLAQQQMVEIAKAISVQSKIIIMDEPSAILTDRELVELFDLIGRLKKQNVAIIYISHRLEEIFKVCDRVTVMRDGKTVQTDQASSMTQDQIIRLMVGREIEQFFPSVQSNPGAEVLRLESINQAGKLQNINLSLRKGEIVGLTGLVGAGRTELARVIFGAEQPDSGRMLLEGKLVSFAFTAASDRCRHRFVNRRSEVARPCPEHDGAREHNNGEPQPSGETRLRRCSGGEGSDAGLHP